MKHVKPPVRWRLKKTLARNVEVRAMEPDDVRYLWAAYKSGAVLGDAFPEGMDATAFREQFDKLAGGLSEGWLISAETRKGYRPAGAIFGSVAPLGAYMVIVGGVWFPWATRRNILEGTVAFLNTVRRLPVVLYATEEHKRLYEVCCMHGVIRRVGTSFVVFPGRQAAMYETRMPDK